MKKWQGLLIILVISLVLLGCSKVTKEHYDRLDVGMEYGEVIAVLGKPDNCKDVLGTRSCIWGTDSRNISVKFIADKAVLFSANGL